MKPDISIIIPLHNCADIIDQVLAAVFSSEDVEKEVILVDDASTDNTLEIVRRFPCRIIPLQTQSGPSHARNKGAQAATADILMFMDADALIEKDTLQKIMVGFTEHPDAACVCGTFKKNPAHSSAFARYRDLQLHYWHQSTTGNASVFILTAGAIKKEVFLEVGGFDAAFGRFADIEDFEIGHRISRDHRIIVDDSICFRHLEHASPMPVLIKKLFRRSRMWMPLFFQRKRFESNYATSNRAAAVLCAGAAAALGILAFFVPVVAVIGLFSLVLFFLLDLGFYRFLKKEGGFVFCLFAAGAHFIMSLVLFCGAVTGCLEAAWNKLKP